MTINIAFKSLEKSHFFLLLKWLELPHVKAWWDQDIKWTSQLIEEKYGDYVHGYKRFKQEGKLIQKPVYAYIIFYDEISIGYIQYYNIQDFPVEFKDKVIQFPENSAAIDWYIGEEAYTGKGIGPVILNMFVKDYVYKTFEYVFINSDAKNRRAIRVYEKIGFKRFKIIEHEKSIWSFKRKNDDCKDLASSTSGYS